MKSAGLALATAILALTPSMASADHLQRHRSPGHYTETYCADAHHRYTMHSGPKVYAEGSRSLGYACGAAWGQKSMQAARAKALRICARYGHDCRVVEASHGRAARHTSRRRG